MKTADTSNLSAPYEIFSDRSSSNFNEFRTWVISEEEEMDLDLRHRSNESKKDKIGEAYSRLKVINVESIRHM